MPIALCTYIVALIGDVTLTLQLLYLDVASLKLLFNDTVITTMISITLLLYPGLGPTLPKRKQQEFQHLCYGTSLLLLNRTM